MMVALAATISVDEAIVQTASWQGCKITNVIAVDTELSEGFYVSKNQQPPEEQVGGEETLRCCLQVTPLYLEQHTASSE